MLAFVDYLIGQVDDVEISLIGYVLHKVAQLFAHVLSPLEREIVKDVGAIHHGCDQLLVLKHIGNGLELLQLLHALREQGFHRREAVSDSGGVLAFLHARQVFRFDRQHE